MSELVLTQTREVAARRLPPVPWRDPHSASPEDLKGYIAVLEQACLDHPQSSDLRTALGMAYAVNYDVYKSMDALDLAIELDPQFFWAQFKRAELSYRLRTLERAEPEAKAALELATNGHELAAARSLLREIRHLKDAGTQKPEWTKSLKPAAYSVAGMTAILLALFGFTR